ncbi:vitamin D3 hydroxylase-associated protein-like isoform X2 [Pleurodeles waltl]|uniref:vitamin D3 hydroxylase-associated protein-like isoform X2 n=1 Tax=Pleurodeles waltl TaxID=8319 RepID=UPI00370983DF
MKRVPEPEFDPRLLVGFLCGSATVVLALKWVRRRRTVKKVQEAQGRREESLRQMDDAVLRFQRQQGEVNMNEILSLSLKDLTARLQDGSISPESALYTYMWKALEVHRQVNCLTKYLPECEEQLQEVKRQKEKGLLYGVPVSIKEDYAYKGHDSNIGLACYLGIPKPHDSVMVQVLKKQGAIPFVKTNIPQSMTSFECSNPIYGQTLNPLNHEKTPGGSSGGEGALIGGGGSVLGLGSDIGGSLRVPASFCGLCSFKPTGARLSLKGSASPVYGMLAVPPSLGPLAKDVDSLALCMRALLCEELFRLDHNVPPVSFNEEVYSSSVPLRIGYYDTDGYNMPVPCMRRAVQETKTLLEKAGHTLIEFTPPRIEYMSTEIFTRGVFADGGSSLLDAFEGDIIDSNLKPQISVYKLSRWTKKILSFILRPLFPRISKELDALCGVGSAKEVWAQHVAVEMYREEFADKWKSLKLDVLLCPAMGPALTIGFLGKMIGGSTNTHLFNVLNFPAGIVPVTTVTKADEEQLKHYKGHYNDRWDMLLKKAATEGVGLPVAVQCVALTWQDELCLRFMKEVEHVTHMNKMKF